ncbi:hypothetical protein O181_036241 [Austropuccinia psidii MF-1]|uniref:Uncharacterized protein n=1 Tax=Austropuccinia psidii MF-1 TaxID=1389203 RepID=A0A9Q3H9R3_9BASI|nr:hypothetical protein [Austropuccinia psidii MF-1]
MARPVLLSILLIYFVTPFVQLVDPGHPSFLPLSQTVASHKRPLVDLNINPNSPSQTAICNKRPSFDLNLPPEFSLQAATCGRTPLLDLSLHPCSFPQADKRPFFDADLHSARSTPTKEYEPQKKFLLSPEGSLHRDDSASDELTDATVDISWNHTSQTSSANTGTTEAVSMSDGADGSPDDQSILTIKAQVTWPTVIELEDQLLFSGDGVKFTHRRGFRDKAIYNAYYKFAKDLTEMDELKRDVDLLYKTLQNIFPSKRSTLPLFHYSGSQKLSFISFCIGTAWAQIHCISCLIPCFSFDIIHARSAIALWTSLLKLALDDEGKFPIMLPQRSENAHKLDVTEKAKRLKHNLETRKTMNPNRKTSSAWFLTEVWLQLTFKSFYENYAIETQANFKTKFKEIINKNIILNRYREKKIEFAN